MTATSYSQPTQQDNNHNAGRLGTVNHGVGGLWHGGVALRNR